MLDLLDRAFPPDQCVDRHWMGRQACATKQAILDGLIGRGEWSGEQSGCHPHRCDAYDPDL